MREIEKKASLTRSAAQDVIRYLTENGFTELTTVRQEDDYYNHPCRDFRVTDEAVRLMFTTTSSRLCSFSNSDKDCLSNKVDVLGKITFVCVCV